MTPMMMQYKEIKSQYPDTLLMFRLGDFYELFMDDAKTASEVLEITLTGRDAGSEGRIPMCGVPYHSVDQYLVRLIEKGFSVAICEQTEDPKQAKGLVRREVVRVVTPGTALPDSGTESRYLAALALRGDLVGLSLSDVGTGEVYAEQFESMAACTQEILSWQPVELLVDAEQWDKLQGTPLAGWIVENHVPITKREQRRQSVKVFVEAVLAQYRIPDLTPLDLENYPLAAEALGMILQYVRETQKIDLNHFRPPLRLRQSHVMRLDKNVLAHLEVLETARRRRQTGSLYGLLNKTKTAMGSRLLKRWLERPLLDAIAIERRQDAVEALVQNFFLRNHIQSSLAEVYDLERLLGRVSFGSANPRDVQAIGRSLLAVPEVMGILLSESSYLFQDLIHSMPEVDNLSQGILEMLEEEPPVSLHEGGIVASGVDEELDELRRLSQSGKTWLAELERREREETGIKNLKVGYNKVFGYYIEVTKGSLSLVPDRYERRQTLAQAERYVLPELKEHEARILNAQENAVEREYELFVQLRERLRSQLTDLQRVADSLAVLDVLCAFAQVSVEGGYVRPNLHEKRGIFIKAGRHPMVEAQLKGRFVPNDVVLDDDQQVILITGPNMAGKSTFMRQTALIVLMAHIGCFVPATSAKIGLVDRIFTRIGASDDLSAGQSTFMVEMVELAQVLLQSTHQSLVLLDEIGRGTSTYDGLSIAEAVLEKLSQREGPLTLFATHYHELTETAATMESVLNASVLVKEEGDSIAFLHTVVNRPASQSYGIEVAKLAGVPEEIILRAQDLLRIRETTGEAVFAHQSALAVADHSKAETAAAAAHPMKHSGIGPGEGSTIDRNFIAELAALNVLNLSPMEAINKLFQLVEEAKEVSSWEK